MTTIKRFINKNGMRVAVEGKSEARRGGFRIAHSSRNREARVISPLGAKALKGGGGVSMGKTMRGIVSGAIASVGQERKGREGEPPRAEVAKKEVEKEEIEKVEAVRKEEVAEGTRSVETSEKGEAEVREVLVAEQGAEKEQGEAVLTISEVAESEVEWKKSAGEVAVEAVFPELPYVSRENRKKKGKKMRKRMEAEESFRKEIQVMVGEASDAAGMPEIPSVTEMEAAKGESLDGAEEKE